MKIYKEKNSSFLKRMSFKYKKKNGKYNEKKIQALIVRYKHTSNIAVRNELIENCYPIIFSILAIFGKQINTSNKILNNDDLFSECVIIIVKCIDSYDYKKKVKFLTFIWVSLFRNLRRFVTKHLLKPESIFLRHDNDEEKEESLFEEEKTAKKDKKEIESLNSFSNNNLDYYKDFSKVFNGFFNEQETRILFLRMNKVSISNSCKILKLNNTKYYKLLEEIKKKSKEEFF